MRYINFNITIKRNKNGEYPVTAEARRERTDGKEGWSRKAEGLLRLEPDSPEVVNAIEELAARRMNHKSMVQMGTLLHEALFSRDNDGLRTLFDLCVGESQQDVNEGVCLRLTIRARQIAVIPWELLYNPVRQTFFATSIETPLMRYFDDVSIPVRVDKIKLPIRILVVIPDAPPGAPKLNTAEERQVITEAIKDMGNDVRMRILEGGVTPEDIHEALVEDPPHIFHFIGHGRFVGERGYLCLATTDLDHDALGELFQNSLETKLVVLNACHGAKVSPNGPFTGLAPQLVKRGVPAVAAMQFAIYDKVAIDFCKSLYHSLFKGADRGRIDLAITHARNALSVYHRDVREVRAFCAPVLFSHSQTGVVFDVPLDKPSLGARPSQEEADRLEAVRRTHENDIDRMRESSAPKAEIEKAEEKVKEITHLLRYRELSSVVAVLVAVFVFFLLWMGVFDYFTLDTKFESYVMAVGKHFVPDEFHQDIAIIPITDETVEALGRGKFDKSWRQDYDDVVRNLYKAGAKVIAFDMWFDSNSPYDAEFATAINEAKKNGTHVIFGVNTMGDEKPQVTKVLEDAFSAYGTLTGGKRWGYCRLVTLAAKKNKPKMQIPGLPLLAYSYYTDGKDVEINRIDEKTKELIFTVGDNQAERLPVFEIRPEPIGEGILDAGDVVADMAINVTPLSLIRDKSQCLSYQDVRDQADPNQLRSNFEGKIVFIGTKLKQEDIYDDRWGVEWHADAVSTLLNGMNIRPVMGEYQFALIVVLSIAGAWLRTHQSRYLPRWVAKLLLVAILALYFTFALFLYTMYGLLLNCMYHIVALFGTYWVVDKLDWLISKLEIVVQISKRYCSLIITASHRKPIAPSQGT